MLLWHKGYQTRSSGFGGALSPQTQHILFIEPLVIDASVAERMTAAGIQITSWQGRADELRFTSEEADIDAMRARWDTAAELMPDLGAPAPSMRSDFTDRSFAIYAAELGVTPDELAPSPFATEEALRHGMSFVSGHP